jgi:hypothetical protein
MKYTLRITATWYDENGNWRCRQNELPIHAVTAVSLKRDYMTEGGPCLVTGKGAKECNINVEILRDGKLFGGWTNM